MVSLNPAARLRSGVFENRNFRLLWSATTIAAFGFYVTDIAMPLLAIDQLHVTAFEAGLIRVAEQLPSLIFGLMLGVLVDRVRKRQLMIWSDVIRSVALLAIPVATWLDHLSLAVVCAVAFTVGTFNLLFDIADGSLLPFVLGREKLVQGNAHIEASYASAQLGGPAIGGALVSLLTAPFAVLVTAVTLLSSASLITRASVVEEAPVRDPDRSMMRDIREGMRTVLHHPLMRPIVLCGLGENFFGFMFLAVYVLYLKNDLHISDFQVGLVFAAGGLGSLVGTLLTSRLNAWLGMGTTTLVGSVGFGLTGMLIPVSILVPEYALPIVIVCEFLQYMTFLPFFINSVTLVQLQSPEHLRGRIMSTRKFMTWGAQPFGSLAGGILGGLITLPWTLAVAEFGLLAVGIWLVFTPIRHLRVFPELEVVPDAV